MQEKITELLGKNEYGKLPANQRQYRRVLEMNKREKQIIKILIENDEMNIKDIALILGCSYKTIQNDILSVNRQLLGIGAIQFKGNRTSFFIQNQAALKEHLEITDDDQDLMSLLVYQLSTRRYVKADEFAEENYLSSSKVSSVIKDAKLALMEYKLGISSRPKYGLYLEGGEGPKRRLLKNLIQNQFHDESAPVIKEIGGKAAEILRQFHYKTTDDAFTRIVMYLCAAGLRRGLSEFEYNANLLDYYKNYYEYQIAAELVRQFQDIEQNENEIAYFTSILCGSRKYHLEDLSHENNLVVKELDDFVQESLTIIKQEYSLDFLNDQELADSLKKHLYALVRRIQNDVQAERIGIENVKNQYPLAYELAITLALNLYQKLNLLINEVEILYFAIYFELALQRTQEARNKKKVQVVCSTGGGLAQLMAMQIRKKYGQYIMELNTTDRYSLENKELDYYDMVLTTIPLEHKKAILIPLVLDGEDRRLDRLFVHDQNAIHLSDVISKDRFIPNLVASDRETALKQILAELRKSIELPDDFYEKIEEREQLMSTSLGNMVAFPHAIKTTVCQTFIAAAILKKPILWDKKKVQIIFLGNIAPGEGPRLQAFYEEFSALITDKKRIARLIGSPTYENLTEILEEMKK